MFNLVAKDNTFQLLESVMDLASARHSLIASNIANVDTPGYKAVDMAFKRELNIALERSESAEFGRDASGRFTYRMTLTPKIFEVQGVTPRQDGNTVDIDRELGKLAKVNSTYGQAVKLYALKLKMLKSALRGD